MPTAKTYAKCEMQGEPFKENGRTYIYVNTTSGAKKVRWYTEAEYAKMYPDEVSQETNIMMTFNARQAFGFGEKGYIIIYSGDEETIKNWAQDVYPPRAWHNLTFGYYTPSTIKNEIPPESISSFKLSWDEVKVDDIHMKSHDEVIKYVNSHLHPMVNNTSRFQGRKDEWLQKELQVKNKTTKQNHFGEKHSFTFVDSEDNYYIWETGTKDYMVDEKVHLKMKVKEHKEVNGINCTIVWYCKEV